MVHFLVHDLPWIAVGFVVGGFFPAWALAAAKWVAAEWSQYVH